jgi:O-antigen/teichoic acid export membrane protein
VRSAQDEPPPAPSPLLATLGNAVGQAARPAILLLAGIAYGPAAVGHLATAFGAVVLATVALSPALGHAVLRHRGAATLTSGLLRRLAAALAGGTLLAAGLAVLDAATLHLAARVALAPAWVAAAVALASLTLAEQYALGACSLAGLLDRYSAAMLSSRAALLLACAALAALHADPLWFLALSGAAAAAVVLHCARGLGPASPGPSPPGLLRDGLAAAPNAWAWFLVAQGSVLLVQGGLGAQAAGLFTLAYLLLNLPILVLQGVSLAWMSSAARHGPAGEWRRTRRLVPRLVAAHALVVLFLAVAGGPVWTALFGPAAAPAFALLRGMAWGAPGFALASLLLPQWVARGWFRRLSAAHLALALAYLAGVAASVRSGSLEAVAGCTAALGLALAAVNLWAARRWDRAPGPAAGSAGPAS